MQDFVNHNADPNELKSFKTQNSCADLWKTLDGQTDISVVYSVEEAVRRVEFISGIHGRVQILVTGSLHLVGGGLFFLDDAETK